MGVWVSFLYDIPGSVEMSVTHGLPGSPRRYDGKYTRPRMRAALAAAAEAYCGYMWAMGLKLLRVSGEWEDPEGDERIEYVNLNPLHDRG